MMIPYVGIPHIPEYEIFIILSLQNYKQSHVRDAVKHGIWNNGIAE